MLKELWMLLQALHKTDREGTIPTSFLTTSINVIAKPGEDTVLVSLCCQPKTLGKREPQFMNDLYQVGLWAYLSARFLES